MSHRDYYEILEVERDAAPSKIKEAYRRLAFQYHPDQNRDNPSAVEKMKVINEAYAVLSDPRKKRDYDTLRERYGPSGYDQFKQTYSEQDIFRGSDINQIFEEMARTFGFRGFEDVFKESYGQGYHTFEFRRPGVFGRGFIFFGPGFKKGRPTEIPNLTNMFPGYLGKLTQFILKKTLGIRSPLRGSDWRDVIHLDPIQAQEGGKVKYIYRRKSKELMITIPQGVREGQKIRLKGMGDGGKEGGEPGDLYLRVKIKKPLLEKVKNLLKI